MRFASFASGSSGNCSVLSAGQTHLMLDAGISNKRIEAGLAEAGLAFSDIGGICVTHEHIDHIAGLRVFMKKHPTPVYATEGTLKGIEARFLRNRHRPVPGHRH
ncbi:MAG: MBL fold metallo-hydrolase [Lachnospiraceae bacterium]|nr:MBL fold metallo-hydrolase [Lachnospiraceae bacterium]